MDDPPPFFSEAAACKAAFGIAPAGSPCSYPIHIPFKLRPAPSARAERRRLCPAWSHASADCAVWVFTDRVLRSVS
jgi:hypothetical protein